MSNQLKEYCVYIIQINDYKYVGCTNNLRRRKDQHNENARNRKSKLGRYLNDNNIILNKNDLQVIYKSHSRQEALNVERNMTFEYDKQGFKLLNDNYTFECTRKGKNIGNTAKQYYVIDFKNHTVSFVNDLRQYCIMNNYPYKELQRTTRVLRYTLTGHKVFYKDDWELIKDKDKFISGKFIDEVSKILAEQNAKRNQKQYRVKFPDNHIEIVLNLDKFARDHNLTSGTLHSTFTKNKPTKGYQVIERL